MTPAEMKEARHKLGLTQSALADAISVTARSVRHWEEGTRAIPGPVATLLRLLVTLDGHDLSPLKQSRDA